MSFNLLTVLLSSTIVRSCCLSLRSFSSITRLNPVIHPSISFKSLSLCSQSVDHFLISLSFWQISSSFRQFSLLSAAISSFCMSVSSRNDLLSATMELYSRTWTCFHSLPTDARELLPPGELSILNQKDSGSPIRRARPALTPTIVTDCDVPFVPSSFQAHPAAANSLVHL